MRNVDISHKLALKIDFDHFFSRCWLLSHEIEYDINVIVN